MKTNRRHRSQILLMAILPALGVLMLGIAPIRSALSARPAAGLSDPAIVSGQSAPITHAALPDAERAKVALITLAPGKPPESAIKAGRAAFAANCASCHQATGIGSPGLIPPLADSDSLVHLTPDEVTRNVLHGRTGPIIVNGASYNSVMPPMGYLPDKTVANIVTYVLNKWGEVEGHVTDEHVALIRSNG